MYSPYADKRGYPASAYQSGNSTYQPQQQLPSGYHYTQGYQTLRPPPINTSYPYSGYAMNRTASYGSSDSGYGTRTPSVASPISQQSYPAPNYSTPGYHIQSHDAGRQLGQQGASYYAGSQRSPGIEFVQTPPVSSSKHKKERRLSNSPPSSPSEYPCLHPNCGHISSRAHDLKRHMTVHFPPPVEELLDCKYEWCGRIGAHGFKREDHRKEHYRKVHMKESEYPKTGKGGRSGRRRP